MDTGLLNQPLALKGASGTGGKENRSMGGLGQALLSPSPQSLRGPNRKETAIKELLVCQFLPC